jgi:hypothetical protein
MEANLGLKMGVLRMKKAMWCVMALGLSALGCGDNGSMNGNGASASMNMQTFTATCQASVAPSVVNYVVTGSHATLTPDSGGPGITLSLNSSANGDRPIYGIWSIPVEIEGAASAAGLSIDAAMEIAPTQVTVTSVCTLKGKKVVATASSIAEVTDTSITIEQTDQDSKPLTYP